jgi:hypothetical protein
MAVCGHEDHAGAARSGSPLDDEAVGDDGPWSHEIERITDGLPSRNPWIAIVIGLVPLVRSSTRVLPPPAPDFCDAVRERERAEAEGPAPIVPGVVWTRAARVRIGLEPLPEDSRSVHRAELIADLSELAHSWTEFPQPGARACHRDQWRELRRRIARADPETLAEARARAHKLRASAELPLRCVFAFLFPREPEWARADALACLAQTGATAVPACAEILVGSIDDPELSKRLVVARVRADEQRALVLEANEIVFALGTRALPVLEALLGVLDEDRCADVECRNNSSEEYGRALRAAELKRRSRHRIPRIIEAVELLRTPEAAAFLAARLGRTDTKRIAWRYFRAEPRLALLVLPRVASGRNKAALTARSMLDLVAREHPELAQGAGKRRAARARPAAEPLPPEASSDELPPVLASPPWRSDAPRHVPHKHVEIPDIALPVDRKVHSSDEWVKRLPNVPPALVFSPRIAFAMASAWIHRVRRRQVAETWLLAFPEIAAVGLVPRALGTDWERRTDALNVLRFLLARDEAPARRGIAHYSEETQAIVAEALVGDPLQECPEEPSGKPRFVRLEALPRPLLAGRRRVLPLASVEHIVEMLMFSSDDFPYAGLAQVRAACDQVSLDAFAWAAYEAWVAAGAPSRIRWPMRALGELGGDAIARRLVPLIQSWPAQRASARARAGVRALGRIGTDIALTHLSAFAELSLSPAVKKAARAALATAAWTRGWSTEELADHTVPDLDLSPGATLTIEHGGQTFRAGFDDHFEPFLVGRDDVPLKSLPRAAKGGDGDKAAEAMWATLQSDVHAIVSAQTRRLEQRMIRGRRWDPPTFLTRVVGHRLMRRLIRGLVLGMFGEDGHGTLFRVTEEGTFADVDDAPVSLEGKLGVVVPHPLLLDDEELASWGTFFADYEILQPFPQLGRAVHRLTEAELASAELTRLSGRRVVTKKLLDLELRGWQYRTYGKHYVHLFWKGLPRQCFACFDVQPGIDLLHPRGRPEQVLGPLRLFRGDEPLPFRELRPVLLSELVRELTEVLE